MKFHTKVIKFGTNSAYPEQRVNKKGIKFKKFTTPPLKNEDEILIENTKPPPPATFLHPKINHPQTAKIEAVILEKQDPIIDPITQTEPLTRVRNHKRGPK